MTFFNKCLIADDGHTEAALDRKDWDNAGR